MMNGKRKLRENVLRPDFDGYALGEAPATTASQAEEYQSLAVVHTAILLLSIWRARL